MAVEGPQTCDGNSVAGANFSNGAGLAGPGGSGQFLAVKQSTAADRTVLLQVAANVDTYGILQNKPAIGDAANVCIAGISKAVYGGTVGAGVLLASDASGRLVVAVSTNFACAKSISAGVIGDVQTVEVLSQRSLIP